MAACRPVLPRSWRGTAEQQVAVATQSVDNWPRAEVPAKSEGEVRLEFRVPSGVRPGRYVIPVDVCYGEWTLPQFQEAIVVI